jgi:hypothetical protein
MKLNPEEIDLAELAQMLEPAVSGNPPAGYLEGRTALRDLLAERIGSSELEAEELIDTMVSRGFLRFSGDPSDSSPAGIWQVDIDAA